MIPNTFPGCTLPWELKQDGPRGLERVHSDMHKTLADYRNQCANSMVNKLIETAEQRVRREKLTEKAESLMSDALQIELLRMEAELPVEDRGYPARVDRCWWHSVQTLEAASGF